MRNEKHLHRFIETVNQNLMWQFWKCNSPFWANIYFKKNHLADFATKSKQMACTNWAQKYKWFSSQMWLIHHKEIHWSRLDCEIDRSISFLLSLLNEGPVPSLILGLQSNKGLTKLVRKVPWSDDELYEWKEIWKHNSWFMAVLDKQITG